ncbi:UNVERIFIED_CONTAM: hypothetical protein Sindi_3130600 [Sesamum indicum]
MPPIPHGRARAPPLLPFSWDASQFGKQFFNHPHHLTRLHHDAEASGAGPDSGREDIAVCHPGGCSTTNISTPSTSASMTRVVTGTFSPPVAISEVGAARVPAFLMTYWWDYDDELMFFVFNMLVDK